MYNVAYITDENYVLPTKVSLASLMEAVQGEEVLVTIVTDEVSPSSRQSLLGMQTANVRIRLVEGDTSLKGTKIEHPYVTKAALNKFYLGAFVPDADKLLFLDGDTLLFQGFLSIFDTDISNAYAAVVPDMAVMRELNRHRELGLDFYFNSGVMLLNLAKIRADSLPKSFINDITNRSCALFMEQDTLNVVFGRQVVQISLAFNCIDTYILHYSEREILEFFGARKENLSSPFVRHLAGTAKPWKEPGPYKLLDWLSKVENEDFLKLAKLYFDALAKKVDDRAEKHVGTLARPYMFGLDMLKISTDGVKLDGFFAAEKWGRWSRSKASIQVAGEDFLRLSGDLRLHLKVRSFHISRTLSLSFNGSPLGTFSISKDQPLLIDILVDHDKVRGSNIIEFVADGDSPSQNELGTAFDPRHLTMGFSFIRITEALKPHLAGLDSRLTSFNSRLANLDSRFASLVQDTGDQGAMIVEMRKSLDEAHAGLRNALGEIAAIHNSLWFKLGRALTFVPRKLRAFFAKL